MRDFIMALGPIVAAELESSLGYDLVNGDGQRDDLSQFDIVSNRIEQLAKMRAVVQWQKQEITAMLIGYLASTFGSGVDHKSPCRYLILLYRMKALLAVDFTAHATRQDIVALTRTYGSSEASARRLVDDLEAQGFINIVSHPRSQQNLVVPAGPWVFSHCRKQLVVMLYRYAAYRAPDGDPLAAATFQNRWVREFGFQQGTLDLAEKTWSGLSI